MPKIIDEIGNTHGRLLVVKLAEGYPRRYWHCLCTCGNSTIIEGTKLRNGHTKSCGCIARELVGERSATYKHGHATSNNRRASATHVSWASMLTRCSNPNARSYKYYGAMGITYDPMWAEYGNFLNDMGERPPGLSLERKDNTRGYYKENCVWATRLAQSLNRSCVVKIQHAGQTLALSEWARKLNIKYGRLYHFVKVKNKSLEDAIAQLAQ